MCSGAAKPSGLCLCTWGRGWRHTALANPTKGNLEIWFFLFHSLHANEIKSIQGFAYETVASFTPFFILQPGEEGAQ